MELQKVPVSLFLSDELDENSKYESQSFIENLWTKYIDTT